MSDMAAPSFGGLTWESFLTNDNIRGLDPSMQSEVKRLWLKVAAPMMYPGFNTDMQMRVGVSNYVYGSRFTPIRPWEDEIVTPESLNLTTGVGHLEASGAYRRLNFGQQQEMKNLWFQKMRQVDPEFGTLAEGQQNAYFQRLMERPPGYDARLGSGARNRRSTGIFAPIPIEMLNDPGGDWNEDLSLFGKFISNFLGAAVTEMGALVTAPLKLLAPENPISQFFLDARKERDWMNSVSDRANFLTEVLPTFVGTMAGIVGGPYMAFERLAATGGAMLLGKVAARVPEVAARAGSAGVAGMVQGIASAVTEGRPWNSNLIGDATLGVGLEFITRYAGAFRALRKTANSMGVDVKHLIRPEYDPTRTTSLTPELEKVYRAMPGMQQFVRETELVDPHGLMLKVLQTEQGVDMLGKVLDIEVRHHADAIELWKGTEQLGRFEGDITTQIRNANSFIFGSDMLWDSWERSLDGKAVMEVIDTSPDIEMRIGKVVPDEARAHIEDFFTTHSMAGYFEADAGVREGILAMDDVYTVLRRSKVKDIPDSFRARGIEFDGNPEAHAAAVDQLRTEILHRFPEKPYFIVNASEADNPRIVAVKDMPVALVEDVKLREPMLHEGVFTGNARHIRDTLSNLKKQHTNLKRSMTVEAHNKGGTVSTYLDDQIVELRTRVPAGGGVTEEVLLHFPTVASAEQAMRKGFSQGMEKVMKVGLFNDLDQGVKKSYDDFRKAFAKQHPERYNSEFLPYAYAVEMGRQNGYYVGMLGGRYIVDDALADVHAYKIFDDLNSVYRYLNGQDMRHVAPSMTPGLSQSTIQLSEPNGIRDPMRDLSLVDIPQTKPMGLRSLVTRYTAPTQWAIQKLENTEAAKWLKEQGYSLTEIYNRTQDANNAVRAFVGQRQRTINRLVRGVNGAQGEMVYRYVEALDSQAELRRMGDLADRFETKDSVFDEMTEAYGYTKADQMRTVATEVGNYFDDLFSRIDVNLGDFLRHYMPHIRAEAAKKAGRLNISVLEYTSNLNVGAAGSDPFFKMARETEPGSVKFLEMLHEADPRTVIFETNLQRLLETYTHLAGREIFMTPTIQQLKAPIEEVIQGLKKSGAVRGDYEQIVHYVADYFDSIEGIHSSLDNAVRSASEESLSRVAKWSDDHLGTKLTSRMKNRRGGIIDTMVTLSTGAHIAGRLFSAGRNMTQSLLTAGSLLGIDWWFKGVDQAFARGGLAHIENLGLITLKRLPLPGWGMMDIDTRVRKLVARGMYPFTKADAINRAISYYAGSARARNAAGLYRKGMKQTTFARVSGAKLHGNPNFNEAMKILSTAQNVEEGIDAFSHRMGLHADTRTQWLYNNFDQPQMFRRGIGRLAGQYTSWPINFVNFVGNLVGPRSGVPALERVKIMSRLTGITSALAYGAYSAGINPTSFMPWNMATVSAGPHFQMATDLAQGIGGDRNSFMRFVRSYANFIPFAYAGESVMRSFQAMLDGDFVEGLLHFTSAPLRTDVYPRRATVIDDIEKQLFKAGNQYIEWMQDVPARVGRREEAVRGLFD